MNILNGLIFSLWKPSENIEYLISVPHYMLCQFKKLTYEHQHGGVYVTLSIYCFHQLVQILNQIAYKKSKQNTISLWMNSFPAKIDLQDVLKTSWRRLKDVFSVIIFCLWRCLGGLKIVALMKSSRHLQDMPWRSLGSQQNIAEKEYKSVSNKS